MWCMLAAPLIAGNDLGNMTPETKEILTNGEVIDLDQDPLGRQGFCFRDNGDYEIWIKQLANDEKAVCLLNRGDEVKEVQVDFNVLLKANNRRWRMDNYQLDNYTIRDLWEHKDVKPTESTVFVKIPPHSVKLYRFIKKK